ncbi:unnamed protein product, partial [Symbiodinium microadriaticum]
VCKDKNDRDDEDDNLGDGVPASTSGLKMVSFETLSMASGSSSSSSATLSSGSLSRSDSEVSRLASQLQGLRLVGSKDSAVSNVTTTASLRDFIRKPNTVAKPTDSIAPELPAKPGKILASSVFAELAAALPVEASKGFPLSKQYAGAFAAGDDDDHDSEAPEVAEPVCKKAKSVPAKKDENPKSESGSKKTGPTKDDENPKSKAGSKKTGPNTKPSASQDAPLDPDFEPYLPNLYSEKRLAFIDANAVQYGKREAAKMWNTSLQKAKMLAGVGLRELKKRKFVPKDTAENPFVKIVKQAKLAAAGGA